MSFDQLISTHSNHQPSALLRGLTVALLSATLLALAGCGGSSSSSSGGASFSSGNATVSGNVSDVSNSLAASGRMSPAADHGALIRILDTLSTPALAATVEGIEVCIGDICTTTDSSGNFLLDTSSLESGNYVLTFLVGGVIYPYNLTQEIDGSVSVLISDIVISDSGTVSVGSVTYNTGDDGTDGDVDETLVDQPEEPAGGNISGNVSSAPDNVDNGGQNKIVLCHKPGTPAEKTLIVAVPATDAHLGHGDSLGACDGETGGQTDDEDDEES